MNNIEAATQCTACAVHGAFIMEGVFHANFADTVDAAWGKGWLELVTAIAEYVPVIGAVIDAADSVSAAYPGVFEYEVCTPFGRWLAARVTETGDLPPPDEVIGYIKGASQKFFGTTDSPAIRTVHAAIARALTPG
jgi:hypothetical protein